MKLATGISFENHYNSNPSSMKATLHGRLTPTHILAIQALLQQMYSASPQPCQMLFLHQNNNPSDGTKYLHAASKNICCRVED